MGGHCPRGGSFPNLGILAELLACVYQIIALVGHIRGVRALTHNLDGRLPSDTAYVRAASKRAGPTAARKASTTPILTHRGVPRWAARKTVSEQALDLTAARDVAASPLDRLPSWR